MKGYLAKMGRGFLPSGEDAARAHARLEDGECVRVKFLRVRDIVMHRRYWALMELCANNCEKIEIRVGTWMDVHSKDDVHTAIKLCTGHFTTICDGYGDPVAMLPKSTSFDEMTADEWAEYWPRVLDVVQEKVLPGVDMPAMETEILKCMGMAA